MLTNPMRLLCLLAAMTLAAPGPQALAQAPGAAPAETALNADASVIPIPPDAWELEYDSTFGGIEFYSGSSLRALEVFYRNGLAKQGWNEDPDSLDRDEDGLELTFTHGDAEIELTLYLYSDNKVEVDLDTDGLDYSRTNDPAALAARGIPQPPSYLYIQKELPFPANIQRLEYQDDGCMFYAPITMKQAYDHYGNLLRSQGYRESRKPILERDRMYTEYKRGKQEISVNVFTDEVGARVHLDLEDSMPMARVAPLPEGELMESLVAAAGPAPAMPGQMAEEEVVGMIAETVGSMDTPINVSNNRGQCTVQCGDKRYVFKHVAAFKTKDRQSYSTSIVFASKPIPMQKLQEMARNEDDFSFGQLYEWDMPDFIVLSIGEYQSFSFTVPGIGIGHGLGQDDDAPEPEDNLTEANGRVSGTYKMFPEEILSRQFSFTAQVDAGIITPNTVLGNGVVDPDPEPEHPFGPKAPFPLPKGVEDLSSSGTEYRKLYQATNNDTMGNTLIEMTKQFNQQGWRPFDTDQIERGRMAFKNDERMVMVELTDNRSTTGIKAVVRETAKAKADGILPEAGKGRMVLGNANDRPVTITIGKTDYPLKAGQGKEDPKDALNYTVPEGKYSLKIKAPGMNEQSHVLDIREGETWGVIVLPTGGFFPMQLY